jgi:hypothetical protein
MRLREFALAAALAVALFPGPARAQLAPLYDLPAALANASAPIQITTATTTQLIAAPAGLEPNGGLQAIYVMAINLVGTGAGNIQFVFGTGSNCGTGQGNLTGNYHLIAGTVVPIGDGGFGPVLILPAGNALCAVTSAAIEIDGSVAYRIH